MENGLAREEATVSVTRAQVSKHRRDAEEGPEFSPATAGVTDAGREEMTSLAVLARQAPPR